MRSTFPPAKLTVDLLLPLKIFEEDASVGGEEGGEHEGLNCHELDEDVERGARGVLERIPNSVTDHSSLVAV